MQSATFIVLLCVIAAVVASVHEAPAEDLHFPQDLEYDTPALERSPRTKRGLLLLKKKLLLGILGLKAAKIGAVGAGVGALALKKKLSVPKVRTEIKYGPYRHSPPLVEVHSISG